MGDKNNNDVSLSEYESKKLLAAYGIPVVTEKAVLNEAEAVSAAEEMGFPVVIKGLGAKLTHKTELGLVQLNITSRQSAAAAVHHIKENAGDDLEGYLIQPHIEGKREFVAGLFRDQHFGPVVMFGLGGIFTEALSDVSFRVAPLTENDANEMIHDIKSAKLLGAFRGDAPADKESLVRALMGLSKIGLENSDIAEIDINPLIVTDKGEIIAVDALVIKSGAEEKREFPMPVESERLGELFYPQSIAFIGATGQMGKWGHRLLTNTISGGYQGKIFLVNPKSETILGRPVYRSVTDIPDQVDLAVITIPAAGVMSLIPQLEQKGIKNMLLISSGFGETGPEGKKLEKDLVAKARKAGILILGPNTMGITNPHKQLNCSGVPFLSAPGTTTVVSQSGNMGVQLINFADDQGIGIRAFVGSGNEAMATIEDYFDALEKDELTNTIVLYIESVKNGRRFFETGRRVGKKKPIILLKGGQSRAGNIAASSHTGALASDANVFNAMCRQAGIVKVEHTMDLLDLAAAFSSLPLPKGERVAIMTYGGGWGVVTADLCDKYDLDVPALSADIVTKLDTLLPEYWSKVNPIDIVGENDRQLPLTVIEELCKWDGCDAIINLGILGRRILFTRIAQSVTIADPDASKEFLEAVKKDLFKFETGYIKSIVKLMEKYQKPIVGVSIIEDENNQTVYDIENSPYKAVFFSNPERAVKSLAKMVGYNRFLSNQ